ncbi:MAG: GDYXXLXY domain-containing protein [Saprospiraceae bacterium]|nr:GDYXXLXY domain-containing protein [Saprospiraceae bacterium]
MLKSILFGLGMFFLLAYPTYLIYEQENILASGTLYKFPLAPVDPYDAFRGKYLALSYHFSDINTTENFKEGDQAFAKVAIDSAGYAYLFDVSHKRPLSPYLSVIADYQHTKGLITLRVPKSIKRYYLNENLASKAELEVQRLRSNREEDEEVNAYASIKIHKGHTSLVELFLDGKPILDYLAAKPKE